MNNGITQYLDGLIHHLDGIQIDDDGSQGLPKSVNAGFAPSIHQAQGAGVHGRSASNKYVNFSSHMDVTSDIDIKSNQVVVP